MNRKQWAERISGRYYRTMAEIIETGRELLAAKNELRHGEFSAMCNNDLPFKERMAQRIMAIARNPWLADPNHHGFLAPNVALLYDLSQIPAAELDALARQSILKPDMEPGVHLALSRDLLRKGLPLKKPEPPPESRTIFTSLPVERPPTEVAVSEPPKPSSTTVFTPEVAPPDRESHPLATEGELIRADNISWEALARQGAEHVRRALRGDFNGDKARAWLRRVDEKTEN